MEMKAALDRFYYELTLSELRLMNESPVLPNISYKSLLYLDVIEMMPDCTVSALAEAMRVSKPAVTMKVGELIRRGLVEKRQSERDRRVYHLRVKPEAMAEYWSYDRAMRKAIGVVQDRFGRRDVDMFCSILHAFADVYTKERTHA